MVRVASIPFISGMLMSIRTRAGLSSSSRATASLPLAASPTSSNSAVRFSTAFMAARNGAWSSTTRTGSRSLIAVHSLMALVGLTVVLPRMAGWWCHPPPGSLR